MFFSNFLLNLSSLAQPTVVCKSDTASNDETTVPSEFSEGAIELFLHNFHKTAEGEDPCAYIHTFYNEDLLEKARIAVSAIVSLL